MHVQTKERGREGEREKKNPTTGNDEVTHKSNINPRKRKKVQE